MSSWAERVHRRAADLGSVVTSCGHPAPSPAYPYRLEKVKFGVPLDEVCKNNNIPGPLLVLILKLNKESPNRRDVFRAPGHQGAMKKLIHFLQCGRLVNVDNYSVYTIASVLKKFLRKIPNGIFGRSGENELFTIIELDNEIEQQERIHRLITSLPNYTQHLLVLLFGTFRVIASNASHACTGMTSEALGVSVAPSFFQSCVSDGKTARMEDVLKFKVATKIMKHIIDKFAVHDMFGRGNYEYYARVTGRILKVQDEWICSFQYPPPPRGKLAQQKYALQHSLEAEKTWLQCQCERWGLIAQEESRSTPALLTSSSSALENSVLSLGVSAEHSFMESCARLSVSLEGPSLFALAASSSIPNEVIVDDDDDDDGDDDDVDDDDNHDDDDGGNVTNGEEDDDEDERKEHRFAMHARDDIENKSMATATATTVVATTTASTTTNTAGVQRRYRRNKQNVTNAHRQLHHHHHHHLHHHHQLQQQHHQSQRSKMKSSDVASDTDCISPPNHRYNSQKSAKISSGSVDGLTSRTAVAAAAAAAAACSRCNRGIRHSSSCCSSSTHSSKSVSAGGGDQANSANSNSNSHMTMDELRAVNRYAESTKSLSYLPQVHERQTARMRTRSEWFLGPKGAISVEMKTCANCYLLHNHHHQLHHQHRHHHHHHHLLNVDGNDDELLDVDDGCDGCDGCGCGGGAGGDGGGGSTNNVQTLSNELYPMFKRRQKIFSCQQQHGQQYHHHHQHHNIENMDTDDSDYSPHSNLNFFSLDSTMLRGVGSGVVGGGAEGGGGGGAVDITNPSNLTRPTTAAAASRIFLKTNFSTISGSYDAVNNSINNNNDNTESTQSSSAKTRINDDSRRRFFSYNCENDWHHHNNNNNNNDNDKQNCKLLANNNRRRCDDNYRPPPTMTTTTPSSSSSTSSSRLQYEENVASRYFSTESILCCNEFDDDNDDDECNRFNSMKSSENDNVATVGTSFPNISQTLNYFSRSPHDATQIQINLSNNQSSVDHHQNRHQHLHHNHHNHRHRPINHHQGNEEVDFIMTSRFRHSTPVSRRRIQRIQQLQRLQPTTSNNHLHRRHLHHNHNQSISLLRRGLDDDDNGGGGVDVGANNSPNSNGGGSGRNNLVTVLFNVLDFLF